jgi:hypothetical protein
MQTLLRGMPSMTGWDDVGIGNVLVFVRIIRRTIPR